MANSAAAATCLKAMFVSLGCLMVATLLYTLITDGSPFRKILLTPWMDATLVDFYINVTVLAVWISYKEASWLASTLLVIALVCLGSITTCAYIAIQLFTLSAEQAAQNPMYYLLLRQQNKKVVAKGSSFQLITARIVFSILGCLMCGVLIYTLVTDGSPFRKELLTPWMAALLIDFYINVAALSVWVCYKESNWLVAFTWIVLLICFGSITTCAYVIWQFFQISASDPLYLVLLNNRHRAESGYEITSG